MDEPIFLAFMHEQTYNTSPIVRHLMLCESSHHAEGTDRAITCEHNWWWGLTLSERARLSNKI